MANSVAYTARDRTLYACGDRRICKEREHMYCTLHLRAIAAHLPFSLGHTSGVGGVLLLDCAVLAKQR